MLKMETNDERIALLDKVKELALTGWTFEDDIGDVRCFFCSTRIYIDQEHRAGCEENRKAVFPLREVTS